MFREGRPVFLPYVDRSKGINGIRRWEQAFRIYAAIYSQANPQRSAEIWQYVFTINTAAATYSWSNVAEYDFAFCQMMARNPKCSWSKIYNQMWNICLTDTNQNRVNLIIDHRIQDTKMGAVQPQVRVLNLDQIQL